MKALTLWRPWPVAIFHLPAEVAKRVENRSWKPPASLIGQRIAIHAGKTWDDDGYEMLEPIWVELGIKPDLDLVRQTGLIGTALLSGVAQEVGLSAIALTAGRWPSAGHSETVQEWWAGPYGWLLDDVRPLPEPIPCKGRQGLWDVPAELVGRLS